jgi:hypothetical protein
MMKYTVIDSCLTGNVDVPPKEAVVSTVVSVVVTGLDAKLGGVADV